MFRTLMSSRVKFIGLTFMPLLVFVLIGCSSFVYPSFSHQGKLLDSSGNPVADGSYTVMYRLYHAAAGGTAVYTDTNTINITDGYFNSDFGAANVDPKIFSEQTWLEISVDSETLSPRQLLRGAPYASGLVAGSAAIGSRPITYTYSTYDNLGSAFFAANTDSTATGGSGITAITTSQSQPGSANRLDVAAVRGLAVNTDDNATTGSYAGLFVSEDFRGIYADGGGTYYAAYFNGNIAVTGSCSGCAMAMTAQNTGAGVIKPGDFVTALGVEVDPDYGIPILLVRKTEAEDTILGVAESAMSRGEYHENALSQFGYEKVAGIIDQEAYVSVVTEGLVQARLPQQAALEIGAFITVEGTEVNTTINIDNSVAQVMSEIDENGLQWILLNR